MNTKSAAAAIVASLASLTAAPTDSATIAAHVTTLNRVAKHLHASLRGRALAHATMCSEHVESIPERVGAWLTFWENAAR